MLAEIEAEIDFFDETGDEFDISRFIGELNFLIKDKIKPILCFYENARFLREGLVLAIAGRPNVGKSSLLNRFAEAEKAIVTDIPGTTRDTIEVQMSFSGIPVTIADTAGIRNTQNRIEIVGIEKTKKYLADADILLFLIDASDFISTDDLKIYKSIEKKKHIVVISKIDIGKKSVISSAKNIFDNSIIAEVSALRNIGITELKDIILKEAVGDAYKHVENPALVNMRQKNEMESALLVLENAVSGLEKSNYIETVAIDLKDAICFLENITGESASYDILDRIFANFCIGK